MAIYNSCVALFRAVNDSKTFFLISTLGTYAIAVNAVCNTLASFNALPGQAINLALLSVASLLWTGCFGRCVMRYDIMEINGKDSKRRNNILTRIQAIPYNT